MTPSPCLYPTRRAGFSVRRLVATALAFLLGVSTLAGCNAVAPPEKIEEIKTAIMDIGAPITDVFLVHSDLGEIGTGLTLAVTVSTQEVSPQLVRDIVLTLDEHVNFTFSSGLIRIERQDGTRIHIQDAARAAGVPIRFSRIPDGINWFNDEELIEIAKAVRATPLNN
ncbi:hypothetical protein [Schaalia suimastitidis]|uniref:hypothetical protein n=1 Tax=Schaalia suimastitidis TaxID=121163 RepID=UPI00047B4066|nr:hypothetical protein [Schaalia suimastitidis]